MPRIWTIGTPDANNVAPLDLRLTDDASLIQRALHPQTDVWGEWRLDYEGGITTDGTHLYTWHFDAKEVRRLAKDGSVLASWPVSDEADTIERDIGYDPDSNTLWLSRDLDTIWDDVDWVIAERTMDLALVQTLDFRNTSWWSGDVYGYPVGVAPLGGGTATERIWVSMSSSIYDVYKIIVVDQALNLLAEYDHSAILADVIHNLAIDFEFSERLLGLGNDGMLYEFDIGDPYGALPGSIPLVRSTDFSGVAGYGIAIEPNGPPRGPSLISPADNAEIDPAQEKVFDWEFNDPDGDVDSQSEYSIRYRIYGATAWTETLDQVSPDSQHTFAANTFVADEIYEWQVRTKDSSGAEGQWSATEHFSTGTSVPAITDRLGLAKPGDADEFVTEHWAANWQAIEDASTGWLPSDTLANRPAPSAAIEGFLFWAHDEGRVYLCVDVDGTATTYAWQPLGAVDHAALGGRTADDAHPGLLLGSNHTDVDHGVDAMGVDAATLSGVSRAALGSDVIQHDTAIDNTVMLLTTTYTDTLTINFAAPASWGNYRLAAFGTTWAQAGTGIYTRIHIGSSIGTEVFLDTDSGPSVSHSVSGQSGTTAAVMMAKGDGQPALYARAMMIIAYRES